MSPTPIAPTGTPEITPLSIKSVIDTGSTYILMVDVIHPEPASGYDWGVITLLDGNGNEIDWGQPNDLQLEKPEPPFTDTWVYQFEKGFVPPITIQYTLKHYVTFQ